VLLLTFDTATAAVTAALHDGARLLAESTEVDARRHGELLSPQIAAVLDTAGVGARDLTAIAVGVGPGPFTGLRVGIVTALTMGAALGIAVHGVCSLDALAHVVAATAGTPFAVTTDARRREVYWARYTADGTRTEGPGVARPADLAAALEGLHVAGQGPHLYPQAFPRGVEPHLVSAAALAEVAVAALESGAGLLPATPLYLRRPDAVAPAGRKRVLA
jgi:tRNA threonylcarbamoyl adenosine modification protein YeaZ